MNATPRTPDGMTPLRPRTDAERLAELVATTAWLSASMTHAETHPGRPVPAAVTVTAQTHARDAFAPIAEALAMYAETADYAMHRDAIAAVGINTADAFRSAVAAHATAGNMATADVLAVIADAIDAGTAAPNATPALDDDAAWSILGWEEMASDRETYSAEHGDADYPDGYADALAAEALAECPDASPDARRIAVWGVLIAAADGYTRAAAFMANHGASPEHVAAFHACADAARADADRLTP